jgi:hypothetical protein
VFLEPGCSPYSCNGKTVGKNISNNRSLFPTGNYYGKNGVIPVWNKYMHYSTLLGYPDAVPYNIMIWMANGTYKNTTRTIVNFLKTDSELVIEYVHNIPQMIYPLDTQ